MKGCCTMDDGALVCICCSVAGKHASIVGCDNTTQFCNYIIFVEMHCFCGMSAVLHFLFTINICCCVRD